METSNAVTLSQGRQDYHFLPRRGRGGRIGTGKVSSKQSKSFWQALRAFGGQSDTDIKNP